MSSVFSSVPKDEWIVSNSSCFAIYDQFPVSNGHLLVIPIREVSTWWQLSHEEQQDIFDLLVEVKRFLDLRFAPDGYNVGFNAGAAAGQTIDHFHLHVIPRFNCDLPDPRGGIRTLIPEFGNYLDDSHGPNRTRRFKLLDGDGAKGLLRPELQRCMENLDYDQVDFVVSFIMKSGLNLLAQNVKDVLNRGGRLRILTSDYLDVTDPDALTDLLDIKDAIWSGPHRLEVRIWNGNLSFHPKAYLFSSSKTNHSEGFIGSSNLSRSGIDGGVEWNVSLKDVTRPLESFARLWNDASEVTREFIIDYRNRRVESLARPKGSSLELAGVELDPPLAVPTPTPIQREALAALEATRANGFRAGLVVMATGLGKTWLSAFDAAGRQRVLFVAHRDEILDQSRDVFRAVHPVATFGYFRGSEKIEDAHFTFASIQTLRNHLTRFTPDEFDYIIVDEFHHAAASSYRSAIEYFKPKFLLGLTATPERMDGADLLSLCGDNLVFRCDLVEGITRNALVPFRYVGLKDSVDFEPIPWRNGKFDDEALADAIETRERAQESLDAWLTHGKGRTLGFCVSIRHAKFMAAYFQERGVKAVAVHSGIDSAPRVTSIELLAQGKLDVVFTVDLFNEGLDVPLIETVLMLRPTDSPVVFLQQLGRGLRKAQNKEVLNVVDFIGNHRSFLTKPRVLLSLGGRQATNKGIIDAATSGDFGLPEGCSVSIELAAVDLLKELAKLGPRHALTVFCLDYFTENGVRPSALQAHLAGFDPKKVRPSDGSWFGLLATSGLLDASETEVVEKYGGVLKKFISEDISKSYKLVALKSILDSGKLFDSTTLDEVSRQSRELILKDPRLVTDVQGREIPNVALVELGAWRNYWVKWPLRHLASGEGSLFEIRNDQLIFKVEVDARLEATFSSLVREIVEWRLADYLLRIGKISKGVIRCRVAHLNGNPVIRFARTKDGVVPEGWVSVIANSQSFRMNFTTNSLVLAESDGEIGNALPALLRSWFGPDAGLPGTRHFVNLRPAAGGWTLDAETESAFGDAQVIPLFSSYKVACGAFDAPSPAEDGPRSEVFGLTEFGLTPQTHFVVFAHGDSMDGGADPLKHGDPLLFEWVRNARLSDLVNERVLVTQTSAEGSSAVLKRLERVAGGWELLSDGPGLDPIKGASDMRVVARLVKRLDQSAINPFASLIGQSFTREQAARLFGDDNNLFKWRQPGHISAGSDEVFFVNVSKRGMDTGSQYVDGFSSNEIFEWSSMASTSPESSKGQAVLGVPTNGRQVHLFARKNNKATGYTYFGLMVPTGHDGSKPIQITFRLLTPLDKATLADFQG